MIQAIAFTAKMLLKQSSMLWRSWSRVLSYMNTEYANFASLFYRVSKALSSMELHIFVLANVAI